MKYVVTGGGGFVGGALVRALKASGHEVVSISRKRYPELESEGIKAVQADLSENPSQFEAAFSGADAVFHVAANVSMWGRYQDFYRGNVIATQNVVEACRRQKVNKLIFTSSPSVIADGSDLKGVDESYPYPEKYLAYYPMTKAMAERYVLAANTPDSLHTIALRPHLVFGPGDTGLTAAVLKKARAGRLVQVGDGENLVDFTFIEDCVSAHLCALRALKENPYCRGRVYFISQGEPVKLWEWINTVVKINGLKPVSRRVSKKTAWALAYLFESAARVFPFEPLFTRFLVSEMTTFHYFNIEAAGRDLGYKPRYTMAEAMQITFNKASEGLCPPEASEGISALG